MPRTVKPMLAELADEPFDRTGWFFEIKWDGYRAIAEVKDGKVALHSRNELDLKESYPEIVDVLKRLGHDVILDGEVVVLDKNGHASFQALQQYSHKKTGKLAYVVFDLLSLDGKDVRALSLRERKQLLKSVLPRSTRILYSDHVETNGIDFFKAAQTQDLEGIMAKNAESPYREGVRSGEWVKVKTHRQQEVVIAGYTEPKGHRKNIGALIAGVYEGDELVYVGHVGGGFDDKELVKIAKTLKAIEQPNSPFLQTVKTNTPSHWVRPELVAEVKFAAWTDDGLMRQPVFIGLRDDKDAREVKREGSVSAQPHLKAPRATQKAAFTHLDKIYWPKEKYTKGDVIAYYRDVSPFILPHLKGRLLSLNRHPDGIKGESFFQKDVGTLHLPPWVKTVTVHFDSGKETVKAPLCQNQESLLYFANLGCIEMNPWSSRVPRLDKPDFLMLDLDPEGTSFQKVVEVARAIHSVLEELEVPSVCKTSGGRGLHVCVPMGAKYVYGDVRAFGELIATLAAERVPGITSLVRDPKRRKGKVYFDVLQNHYGATNAAPYSLRPRPGAPVSTPLHWKEVNARLDPAKFTIRTALRRFERVGDLFALALGEGVDLKKVLKRIQETNHGL